MGYVKDKAEKITGIDFSDPVSVATLGFDEEAKDVAETIVDPLGVTDGAGELLDDLSGKTAEEAAEDAARVQQEAGLEAIKFQREALEQIRADLEPFRQIAGPEQISALQQQAAQPAPTIRDPETAIKSPFFQALADEATRRLSASQASRGKLGSGGTAEALQQRMVAMGSQLAGEQLQRDLSVAGQQQQAGQQRFNQLFDLTRMGQSAAAQQAAQQASTTGQITGLQTGIANAQAAGMVGGA